MKDEWEPRKRAILTPKILNIGNVLAYSVKGPKVEDRIILHLSRYPHSEFESGSVPYTLTQNGIAEEVGISRNYVSVVLSRMERRERDLLIKETRHIRGFSKMRRAYFLTQKGMERAAKLIDKWKNEMVEISLENDGKITIQLSEIGRYLGGSGSIIRGILLMDGNGVIHIKKRRENLPREIFVGRYQYVDFFNKLLQEKDKIKGKSILLIFGEPGIGKTTLAMKFGELWRRRGFIFIHGKGYMNLQMPYLPLTEAFENREVEIPYRNAVLKLLKRVSHLPMESNKCVEYERNALWYDLGETIDKIASTKPLLIFIDDLQWVDETTLKTLHFLCVHLRDSPVLFVGAYRTDGYDFHFIENIKNSLKREDMLYEIPLKPLSLRDISDMLRILIGTHMPDKFVRIVEKITRGNPLFIREIIQKMVDDGTIVPEENKYPLEIEDFPIPKSIESIINEKIKRLKGKEKVILQISSVIGEKVPYILLKDITKMHDVDLLGIIDTLIDYDLLEEGLHEHTFTFTHPLIPLTVYRGMKSNVRKIYHRIIAESTERMVESGVNIDGMINLGYHYEKSGEICFVA